MVYRKLHISTRLLRRASKEKGFLDALAFCVLIKERYINSTLTDCSIRKIIRTFHISQAKATHLLAYCIEEDLCRYYGAHLVANKLHSQELCVTILPEYLEEAERKHNRLSIAAVKDVLRMLMLTNHISMCDDVNDTHNRAESTCLPLRKKARARLKRMLNTSYHSVEGLSLTHLGNILVCGKDKVISVVSAAIKFGLITKQVVRVYTPLRSMFDLCPEAYKFAQNEGAMYVDGRNRELVECKANIYACPDRVNLISCH